MQITEKHDITDLLYAEDQFFKVEYLRVVDLGRILPLFVEIVSRYIGAVVAVNDTVRVQHGYDLEDETLSQSLCLWVGGEKKLNDAVANV